MRLENRVLGEATSGGRKEGHTDRQTGGGPHSGPPGCPSAGEHWDLCHLLGLERQGGASHRSPESCDRVEREALSL